MAKSVEKREDWTVRAKVVARRPWRTARDRLREAAEDVLHDALTKLEQRMTARERRSAEGKSRVREVLERDRAVAWAEQSRQLSGGPVDARGATGDVPGAKPAPAPAPAAQRRPGAPLCDEPIRTRTYAGLLAAQGEHERALRVYVYLLHHAPEDGELAAEVDRLTRLLGES